MDEKPFENILIYDLLCKTFIGTKPLRIMFDKVDDGTKCLVLFVPEKYDAIFDRMKYVIGLTSSITYVASHNCAKIKIGSNDDLPEEETLSMQNVVILIKSVFNKSHNQQYCKIFSEKLLYQIAKI